MIYLTFTFINFLSSKPRLAKNVMLNLRHLLNLKNERFLILLELTKFFLSQQKKNFFSTNKILTNNGLRNLQYVLSKIMLIFSSFSVLHILFDCIAQVQITTYVSKKKGTSNFSRLLRVLYPTLAGISKKYLERVFLGKFVESGFIYGGVKLTLLKPYFNH